MKQIPTETSQAMIKKLNSVHKQARIWLQKWKPSTKDALQQILQESAHTSVFHNNGNKGSLQKETWVTAITQSVSRL
jgi:hypothetical protein